MIFCNSDRLKLDSSFTPIPQYVSGQIGIRCFNVNSLFICYAGMAEVKQQLIELRHEIKASKVNQTGGEGRVFDKGRVKPTCRK